MPPSDAKVKEAVSQSKKSLADAKPFIPAEQYTGTRYFLAWEARWARKARTRDHMSQSPKPQYRYVNDQGVEKFNRARFQEPGEGDKAVRKNKHRDTTAGISREDRQKLEEAQAKRRRAEDSFHARPSIKIPMPDHLKAILVDDWENITKNNQLVPLPHKHTVNKILGHYLEYERPNRQQGTAAVDVLEETIEGLKEYFNKALGRILLYRFERPQYVDFYKAWKEDDPKFHHKNPCDTYGPEHLCRLLVSMPELLAQTNMDQQSVNRLREELAKLTAWLGDNHARYFASSYDTPSQQYKELAS